MSNFRNLKFIILLALTILSVYYLLHMFNLPTVQAAQAVKKTLPNNLVVHGAPQPTTNEFNGPENLYETPANSNLTFDADFGSGVATKTMVIFVSGNLIINSDIKHVNGAGNEDPNSGVVFVVKGNVNIATAVTQVNAVIIAEGVICTAFDGTNCLDGTTTTPKLTINGSIVSLNPPAATPDPRCAPTVTAACPLKFVRSLADNTTAAEVINYQPKYLVILRDLFSDTLQRWSEVDASTPTPTGSFNCNQYNGDGEENSKLCSLSGCKKCINALNTCIPSGGDCS